MITIKHYNGLNRTPALFLAVEGWMELIKNNHCGPVIIVKPTQNAVVAFVDDEPAGVITYEEISLQKEFSIGLGYIIPKYRGLKIYNMLWDALVAKAKETDIIHIGSSTYLTNTNLRAIAFKQGRIETNVWLEYDIPAEK